MKLTYFYVFLLITMIACHKDTDIITGGETPDPPEVLITTKLITQTDTNSTVALNAMQIFGGAAGQYAGTPYLVSKTLQVDRDFELLTIRNQDQIPFYHVHDLVENNINYVHWTFPQVIEYSGQTSLSAEIIVSADHTLTIPAHSLMHADSTPYEGGYKLVYALINPFSAMADAIPSFTGMNELYEIVSMQFQTCFYVTAFSEAGTKLIFSKDATLHVPPTSGQKQWNFIPSIATWTVVSASNPTTQIELGSAEYYSIASSLSPTRITGKLLINGLEASHQQITLHYDGYARTLYTTNTGAWVALVPQGFSSKIQISLPCNTNFEEEFITPAQKEMDLVVDVNNPASINTVITGTIGDCNGVFQRNGVILINGENPNFYFPDKPNFTIHVPMCENSVTSIQGLYPDGNELGPIVYWDVQDTIALNTVMACEEAQQEYLLLNVDGAQKMYWDLKTSITDDQRLLIENGNSELHLDLELYVTGMEEGSYEANKLNIILEDRQLGGKGYSVYCPTSDSGCGFTKFVITHFPAEQGQWIRGYFEGNFWMKSFQPLSAGYRDVRGEFQVYRDF